MTKDEDFKALIRARMGKTGESYATARRQILADSPSWSNEAAVELAERVDQLEAKVARLSAVVGQRGLRPTETELMEWDPPPGVSRQGGEIMFRCSVCAIEARGFASMDTAVDALKSHFRESDHTGPYVLFTDAGYETIGSDESADPTSA